ncbi:MAG: exopolysaccharide biosynthesis protein [Phycisphaerae bacterium]
MPSISSAPPPQPDRPPTRPGRRLRLSIILTQLRDEAIGEETPESPADSGASSVCAETATNSQEPAPRRLSGATDFRSEGPDRETPRDQQPSSAPRKRLRARSHVTIGEIVDRTREAGFGVLLAFLAIAALPIPGVSVLFGLVIAVGASQMVIGMHKPWVPRVVRNRRISVKTLDWISVRVPRWTAWLEVLVRPRFTFMTRGFFWSLCGLAVLIQGLGLALPLPIPWSNSFFALPIVLYAIALLESDGLLMLVSFTISVYQIVFVVKFWDMLVAGSRQILSYFGVTI